MEKTTPEKMMQRSGLPVILKKLNELESELTDVFRLQPETPHDLRHEISFDDIVQRFDFLKNLYTAEFGSHDPRDTDELRQISKRIKALEHDFHLWNALRTSHNNLDETLSVCSSCTQRLLFEEERESESSVSPQDDFYGDSGSPISLQGNSYGDEFPEKSEVTVKIVEARSGRICWKIGKFCGVFGSGMIAGAIFVVNLLNSSDFPQNEAFLHLPPT